MKRFAVVLVVALAVFAARPATMSAESITINPYNNPSVNTAINDGGFFVGGVNGEFGVNAWTDGAQLYASGTGYSDAGIVLFLNGGLTLGQLQSVSVNSTGDPLSINLWLGTGADGKFFNFVPSTGLFTGLNGDSYAGCGLVASFTANSCYMLGGNGAGGTYTLAQLQAGVVPGIDANTPTALWIGLMNDGGSNYAYINSVTVNTTSPVPEPASLMFFGTGLAGVAGVVRRKLRG